MARSPRVTIVLLAGGDAKRLPGKLALAIGDEPMLARVYRRLTAGGRPCIISVRDRLPVDAPELADIPIARDEHADGGPLGGLASAAARVTTPMFFAAAGDMPDMDSLFVDALEAEYDRARKIGRRPQAVVPVWPDGKVEPLAALYGTRDFVPAAREVLASGQKRVSAVFDHLRVVRFAVRTEDEARLANVNTPADYEISKPSHSSGMRMHDKRSAMLFEAAARVMPGGVNSPVRAFRAVGGTPRFIARGEGPRIYDADGREYVDYLLSWGPLILGHAHPAVISAVERAARAGTSFGAPTEYELELAQLVVDAVPSIEKVRFVNSGTEACMSALRLARAWTGRNKIVKCAGCYHGHADSLLVSAGSGALTLGIPDSPGVPSAVAADTIVVPFNDVDSVARVFSKFDREIACVIVEPIAGNMGFVRPKSGYLERLRDLTKAAGALLIFDEVMTGFRVAYGGAQSLYAINPDLTCLGKVIGAGLPVGAFGGRADIMDRLAPVGNVYQAGTLSGNPLAMAAGIAQVRLLKDGDAYERMERIGTQLIDGLRSAFADAGVPAQIDRIGSMWGVFFCREPVTDLASARKSDTSAYAAFFTAMLERGVYLAPSQFEAAFLSTAHSKSDIESTCAAARESLANLTFAAP